MVLGDILSPSNASSVFVDVHHGCDSTRSCTLICVLITSLSFDDISNLMMIFVISVTNVDPC